MNQTHTRRGSTTRATKTWQTAWRNTVAPGGQVTRELAENTREDYARLEAKINVILIGIFASPFAAAFLNGLLRIVPGQ